MSGGFERRRRAILRYGAAAALVASVHAGAFAWLATHSLSDEPDSVQGAPIDLELLAVAPPAPLQNDAAPSASPDPTPAPAPSATPEPSPSVTEPPPPSTEPTPPPSPEPAPPPAPEPSPEPPPPSPEPPSPQPTEELPPPAPAPTPEPLPRPLPTRSSRPDAVVAPTPPPPQKPRPKPSPKPFPKPPPKPGPEEVQRPRERAEAKRQAREKTATERAAAKAANASAENLQGAAAHQVSSGTSLATWRGEVLARLSEYKPVGGGATGTAVVAFTVDGGGRVVSASLARSCGDPALDAASVAMVRRASPVPAPPPELGGHINLSVPVRFR